MAELYGKATGCRGGRGGSMHLADQSLGFLGGNGIVGAGLGVAMGAALGAQVRSTDQVVVGIFGDGGANTGRTWESVNIASVWKLPLIVVCENNVYAVETETALLTGGGSISRRAEGFGLPVRTIDGQDVAAMHRATEEARQRAAAGDGPTFIEALTYRYEGHSTGQVINYRTIDEVREWRDTRDPIQRLRLALDAAGALDESDFDALLAGVQVQVDDAIVIRGGVTHARPTGRDSTGHRHGPGTGEPLMAAVTLAQAYQQGMREEMERDQTIFLLGTDLYDRGGHFAQVLGLGKEFGRTRVRDMPISEAAMMAAGVGAALNGTRPVVDLNFIDFAFGAMDEIINQAAKMRYMFGTPMPLVIRASSGVALYAAQHNNSLEALFASFPGLLVALPSTPADTKGLLKSALRGQDPVIFMMHKRLGNVRGEVGGPDDLVPFGRAAIRREGSDVTIVAYSHMVVKALAAAESLAQEGIDAEVDRPAHGDAAGPWDCRRVGSQDRACDRGHGGAPLREHRLGGRREHQ